MRRTDKNCADRWQGERFFYYVILLFFFNFMHAGAKLFSHCRLEQRVIIGLDHHPDEGLST